jgi:archaellum component FlaC
MTELNKDLRSLNSLEDIEFAVKRIDELEDQVRNLHKALEIYQRDFWREQYCVEMMC